MRRISEKYYQDICRQHRSSIKKQQRQKLLNNDKQTKQLQAIFDVQIGEKIIVSEEIIQKLQYYENLKSIAQKIVNLDMHKSVSIAFVKKFIILFQILPYEFLDQLLSQLQTIDKITLFLDTVIDKQQWMNSLMLLFLQILTPTSLQKESKLKKEYIEKICQVMLKFWNMFIDSKQQQMIDFDILCEIYSQIIQSQINQNDHQKKIIMSIPVLIKKTLSKSSIKLIMNTIHTNQQVIYNILFHPFFSSFMKEAVMKLPIKQTLVVLFQITCYQNWNMILKSDCKQIALEMMEIYHQKDELQILVIIVLGNFTKQYYEQLEGFFDTICFEDYIKNLKSKNINDGIGVLLLILQFYGSDFAWDQLFNKSNLVRLVMQQCENISSLDLYEHLIFIVQQNIENISYDNQNLHALLEGSKKFQLPEETFELVMEIQNYFMMESELI